MREPPRPLGAEGRRLWGLWVERIDEEEDLVAACELADERTALRLRVLRDGDPADRKELRVVDDRLSSALEGLHRADSWGQFGRRRSGWWAV